MDCIDDFIQTFGEQLQAEDSIASSVEEIKNLLQTSQVIPSGPNLWKGVLFLEEKQFPLICEIIKQTLNNSPFIIMKIRNSKGIVVLFWVPTERNNVCPIAYHCEEVIKRLKSVNIPISFKIAQLRNSKSYLDAFIENVECYHIEENGITQADLFQFTSVKSYLNKRLSYSPAI